MTSDDLKDWRARWERYNQYQQVEKTAFLRQLTARRSIDMFFQLHAFAQQFVSKAQRKDHSSDMQKIHHLARVHALFSGVRS